MCFSEQNKRSIVEEGGVQALSHMANFRNLDIQRNIVSAFCELSARGNYQFLVFPFSMFFLTCLLRFRNNTADLRSDLVGQATPCLVTFAQSGDAEIQTSTASALANLCEHSASFCLCVCLSVCLPYLYDRASAAAVV